MRLLTVTLLSGAGLVALPGASRAEPAVPPSAVVPPRGSEPAITTPGEAGDYLRRIHDRLHGRWTETFIKTVSATYPPGHSLNNPSRQVLVALTIRWDGTVAEIAVKKSSGSPEFDRAAADVIRKSAPYPLPVASVISDDTYAHLEWTFARDQRACGAGARIVRVDDPLDVSLSRLVLSNRIGEALRRVGDVAKDDGDAGLDRFARLYLGRTVPDPMLNAAASLALAQSGDRSQVPRLRAALGSRATVEIAARGLHALGIDICDALRTSLEAGTTPEREVALAALHAAAADGSDVSACGASLGVIVADARQPRALRLSALDDMQNMAPAAARAVVMATVEDKDPALRGAAILASVRKGAGRPEMYRLAPLLHDKAVEVRGAASAGMVRAGGDGALEQLYLLGRETDPRPGQWVAAELAQMSTRASAAFLGTLLKKNNAAVQVAAARALAARKDSAARTELDSVKTDARMPTEVRAIATGSANPGSKPAPSAAGTAATAVVANATTEPVRQFLKENRNREAAIWIVEKLASLDPRDAVDVLGAWLRRAPAAAAEVKPSVPASPPQSAAPRPATPEPATPEPATPATTSALAL